MKTQRQWLFETPFQLPISHYESLGQSTYPQFESAQEWEFHENSFHGLDAMATDKSGKGTKSEKPPKTTSTNGSSTTKKPSTSPTTATPEWFGRFQEPLHKQAARDKETDILQKLTECHKLGTNYQQLVAEDLGAADVQEKSRKKGLRVDIGTVHEVTAEGRNGKFSPRKMGQLKTYLETVGGIMLTVPKLSKEAEKQLTDLGKTFEKQGKTFRISVRETCSNCKF